MALQQLPNGSSKVQVGVVYVQTGVDFGVNVETHIVQGANGVYLQSHPAPGVNAAVWPDDLTAKLKTYRLITATAIAPTHVIIPYADCHPLQAGRDAHVAGSVVEWDSGHNKFIILKPLKVKPHFSTPPGWDRSHENN